MSNRIELNDQETDNVIGGALRWTKDGTVYPKNDPSVQYTYTDYYECQAWLVKYWDGVQNEATLQAMETAGLVHKK